LLNMNTLIVFLIIIFVAINFIEIWLMFHYKKLVRGGIILGAMEAFEFPLIIYLIMKGGVIALGIVIFVEAVQWLIVPYLTLKR